ncbi:MAG TPA: DNA (cytosine-5-)-methyltransferase [Solirubrobacteraceae bacterium]|nr:DNA (cytosine-5-)-methyltransferase [Solirubrobacteraceae bacterium]
MSTPDATETIFDHQGGTAAPWYEARDLSDEKRAFFRERALRSRTAKLAALEAEPAADFVAHRPALDPAQLMPCVGPHLLPALSLFSGGGGLDLGFERAGFAHIASYDTLEAAGETLLANRPSWEVHSQDDGDVRGVDWRRLRGELAVLHGGPPCQPFSVAGRQRGQADARNMLPEFLRAVLESRPLAFVCENVPALAGPKFAPYLHKHFLGPLSREYCVTRFRLSAHDFGVPQLRHRVFFVGFRSSRALQRFQPPDPTHRADHLARGPAPALTARKRTLGVRAALGLGDIGVDGLAPTVRSTLTGPRHTTSILSSVSAQRAWAELQIWPNGVARTRSAAARFPTENGHFRLAVADVALLQGFPSWWHFHGAVYMSLGQIGNSVAPPIAYRVARAVAHALGV